MEITDVILLVEQPVGGIFMPALIIYNNKRNSSNLVADPNNREWDI